MKYKNLLIIDDDTEDLDLFKEAVDQFTNELNCHYYDNSEIALNHLYDKSITPDAIFLDLNMPKLSGEDLLSQLKAHNTLHAIPVFILSSSNYEPKIKEIKELGAQNFLIKPTRFSDLVTLLQEQLAV